MQICITECNTKSLSEATKVVAKKDYASHSKFELMLKFVAVSTFIMSHGRNVSVAEMTEGSRAEVKKWIRQGRVYVNETKVQRPETKLDPDRDQVTLDGEQIIYEQFCYYMLNKPAGVVSATTDREHKTVIDLLQEANTQDVFPVGRLDIDTEGLLLLTNDGALAHELLSPRKHVDKTYFVRIAGNLSDADVKQLEQGMDIGIVLTESEHGDAYLG